MFHETECLNLATILQLHDLVTKHTARFIHENFRVAVPHQGSILRNRAFVCSSLGSFERWHPTIAHFTPMGHPKTNSVRGVFISDCVSLKPVCQVEDCWHVVSGDRSRNLECHLQLHHQKLYDKECFSDWIFFCVQLSCLVDVFTKIYYGSPKFFYTVL